LSMKNEQTEHWKDYFSDVMKKDGNGVEEEQ
jgi:hypothetical protein